MTGLGIYEELAQTPAAAEFAHMPEYAWRKGFLGGEMHMSWRACRAYGLDPLSKVTPAYGELGPGLDNEKTKDPRSLNLAIVAPEEIKPAIHQMMGDHDLSEFQGSYFALANDTRINMVASFALTRSSSREDQVRFLEDEVSSLSKRLEWQRKVNNGNKGLPYVVGHSLVNLVMEESARLNLDRSSANKRALQTGRLIHNIFFRDEHEWRLFSKI